MASKKAYEKLSKKFQNDSRRLIDNAAKDNVALLRNTRNRIAAELAERGNVENLPTFRRSTQYYFERFGDELERKMDRQLERAWELGKKAVDDPLRKAGHDLRVSSLPASSFDTANLETYRREIKDTIHNIAADGARRVNNAATFGVLGGREQDQIAKDIGKYVTRGQMKKVASQVEGMTKTETARIYNLSMRNRLKQAGKEIGKMKKYWQHIDDGRARPAHSRVGERTNPNYGGKPIAYDSDFSVGGERAFAPLDPRLSDGNVYGCRCGLGFFVEE